jgi:polyribonucleotide nucleotidyltransferase
VLSHDLENDPDIVAMIGCSAALTPVRPAVLGSDRRRARRLRRRPVRPEPDLADVLESSKLDLVVAGTTEGVLMVESEAQELSEEVMLGAVNSATSRSSR